MNNKIRFLVLWIGTKCTLKCRNCCNLIPYVKHYSYNIDDIMANLDYITKTVEIECLQIQGGEPFTHKQADKIIEMCAINNKIHKIEIASNGTILPNTETIQIIKKYKNKVTIRFSNYSCGKERRKQIEDYLQKEHGIYVQNYEFMYDTGEWFDLGDVDNEKECDFEKISETYRKCPNKSCWTLAGKYLAGCGRMISYLMLKNEKIEENNILDIEWLRKANRPFIDEYQKFEKRYNTQASDLCGYCRISNNLIPAAIQMTSEEVVNYKKGKR